MEKKEKKFVLSLYFSFIKVRTNSKAETQEVTVSSRMFKPLLIATE